MNQADEECSEQYAPSLAGHRLSLSDLFCTESLLPSSPYRATALVAAAAAAAAAVAASSGLEGFRLAGAPAAGQHGVTNATNPFFVDLFRSAAAADPDYHLVQPYLHEQFQWKHDLQAKYRVNDYLSCHPNVTSAMRSELILWLSKANRKLGYDIETFLLAVNYVDRFLAASVISADHLQLLGLAAILVAAKKEEVSQPDIDELVGICAHTYPAQLIRDMEICLLKKLDFQLSPPTASYFFEYYMTFTKEPLADIRGVREVFHQLLENSLVHYELIHYPPSTVAAAALCLVQQFLPNVLPVEPLCWLVEIYSGSSELGDIQRCFVDMSLWHHAWRQQSLCWARVAAATAPQSSTSVHITTGPTSIFDEFFAPAATLCNPFTSVDFCKQFANFSLAPQ